MITAHSAIIGILVWVLVLKQALASYLGSRSARGTLLRALGNDVLASCPWGPATAHGVGILTESYTI